MKNIWYICIHLVTTRPYPFSHDPFIPFRLRSVHTLLVTARLHFSYHNPFATFQSRPFSPFSHVPFALFWHNLYATFRSWPFASFWSQSICTFLVTFMTLSHPFGHDLFISFVSQPVRSISVTTCMHIFWSWHIRTLSFTTRSHPLDHDTIIPLRSQHVRTSYITTHLYILDQNKFVPLRWWHHINIYNCLIIVDIKKIHLLSF